MGERIEERQALIWRKRDALADEAALLAEGTGKADERYMSRVAHLAPPPSPPKGPPVEETKA